MSRCHVIHVCGCCGGGKREDTGCFGELGGLRASMSTWALSVVTGTALADQMSYLSKTMRVRVSKALYGPGSRRSGWWRVDGSQREASSSRWWW
jgi:hypothetical protein